MEMLKRGEVFRTLDENRRVFEDLKVGTYDKFSDYLRDNFHIYEAFEQTSVDLCANGKRDKYGAFAIINKLRWDSLFHEVGTDFKISNNFAPSLARLTMLVNPQLDGMFVTKSSRGTNG